MRRRAPAAAARSPGPGTVMAGRRSSAGPKVLALALLLGAAGCAAPRPVGDAPRGGAEAESSGGAPTGFSTGPLAAMLSGQVGMEVHKWIAPDDPEAIVAALSQWTEPIDDDGLRLQLSRNGWWMVRMAAEDVEPLRAALGDAVSDLRSWQGQSPAWREIVSRGARTPIGVFVDGRTRVFADGALRLSTRSWTLPTEDGVLMQLELAAEFEPTPRGALRDRTRDGAASAVRLPPGEIELQVLDGEAWLLTCIGPEDDLAARAIEERRRQGGAARSGEIARARPEGTFARSGPVPDGFIGPAAAAPQTIGEVLLRTEMPATRTLLVFVPRLPPGSLRRDPAREMSGEIDFDEAEAGPGDPDDAVPLPGDGAAWSESPEGPASSSPAPVSRRHRGLSG
ncbi:MAG TPA: hypothetical protein PKC43_06920 [Phycisphaerales bacterium]|nr:hypothetical protein [Phycisphaerales bacterium]HMP37165.1 hypothetical protein [Phycisphaerales bacterium]